MPNDMVASACQDTQVLKSLLQVGVNLASIDDLPATLDMILLEIRKIARAEAGNLYILEEGGTIKLVAAQNDRVARRHVDKLLIGKEVPLTNDSMAGLIASTGEEINIANSYLRPAGTPFRVDRKFDAATGYRGKSLLGFPLCNAAGTCLGVVELFNCLDKDGKIGPFDDSHNSPIRSLAAIAGLTIHNALLQEQLKRAQLDTIIRLSVAAEFRDDETAGHVRRVSETSALIAREMGLGKRQEDVILLASPMHDVGKIGIPDTILLKPGRLDAEERKAIEEHPVIASEILGDPLNDVIDAARAVALTHHEKWDGTGYPSGLKGKDIPIIGRIVAVADVFDALVSKRCYRDAFSMDKALDILREETGTHFDPEVVRAFFNIFDEIREFYEDPAVRKEAHTLP